MKTTLKQKIFNFLSNENATYNTLSAAQAAARFRVTPASVKSAIRSLKNEGHPIYANDKRDGYGEPVVIYRLGTPTKAAKAAARKAKRA
jgi:predicted ArsR family transcriptional regulator